jgi:peptidoglycan/LPS O-acetylase OafA/YrhL
MEQQPHRLAYLDALRGFAILGVIVYHCFLWTGAALPGLRPILKQVANQGGNGVQLFFVVSAFALSLSIQSSAARGAFSLAAFFRNRFFRIVPLYWIAAVWYIAENRFRGGDPIPWLQVFAGATFTNGWVPGWMNAPVSGGWSIMMEVYFYFALPFLFAFVKDWRRAALLILACLGLQILTLNVFPGASPGSAASQWTESLWFLMPTQAVVFALGLLLFRLQVRGPAPVPSIPPIPPIPPSRNPGDSSGQSASLHSASRTWTSLGFIGSGGILIAALLAKVDLVLPPLFLFSVAYVLIALGLARRPWSLLCNPLTCAVGKASYSAYLCHFALLDGGMAFLLPPLQRTGWHATPVFLVFTALMILLTGIVSQAFYRGLEVPLQRFNHGRWGGANRQEAKG